MQRTDAEIAAELGMSERQVRVIKRAAIARISDRIWPPDAGEAGAAGAACMGIPVNGLEPVCSRNCACVPVIGCRVMGLTPVTVGVAS